MIKEKERGHKDYSINNKSSNQLYYQSEYKKEKFQKNKNQKKF
jgi:hypothetical protein